MRIKRTLSALLCVVMVVCCLPLMQVSATDIDGYDSLGDIVGEVIPVFDFQFKEGFTGDQSYLHSNTGNITYTDENGIEFSTGGVWGFTEGDNTTPMSHGAVGFTWQATDNIVTFQVNKADNSGRAYFTIKSTGFGTNVTKVYDGGFQPWYKDAEYVVKDEGANYSLYAKSDAYTEGKWILAFTAPYEAGKSAGQGLRFDASSGYLKSFKVYQGNVATAYDFDFKADFDGTMKFTDRYAAGIETPDGATYTDENGLTMPSTSSRWRFRPYDNTSWSCLSNGGNRSAVMFSMKLPEGDAKTNVTLGSPDYTGRVYLDLFTDKIAVEGGPATTDSDILPGIGWVDYLVVPDSLTGGTTSGFALYMKSDSLTGGEWVKKLTNTKYGSATDSAGNLAVNNNNLTGITINAANTCIKNLKVLSIDDVVADSETTPADADFLYYNEGFDEEPTYLAENNGNLQTGGVTFDTANDGYAVLQQTEQSGYPSYYLNKAGIPVGGYAEIKVRAGARMNFSLPTPDATQRIKLDMRKEKGTINDTSVAFIGDGGNTWWTYRILCNSNNTYDVYVKAEGDTAWLQLANDIAAMAPAGTGPDRIAINQYEHIAGAAYEDYSSSIDYIKIYGPQPDSALVLTDGHGTKIITDQKNIQYPKHVYALAEPHPDSEKIRKFILAKYGLNQVLLDVDIFDVAGTETVAIPLDISDEAEEIREFRTYFWEDFNSMQPVSNSKSMQGGAAIWTDAWNFGGNAKEEDGTIFLHSSAGVTSSAEWNTTIDNAYDISWTMSIENYNGTETAKVYAGGYCVSLAFSPDEFSYLTSGDTITTQPWAIGTETHTYRLIFDGTTCRFYIDGYRVAEMTDIPESTETSKICFQNGGSGTEASSNMRIASVSVDAYSAETIPSTTGFYDTFTNGDACGWTMPTETYANGETVSWESKDGYLQVDDHALIETHPQTTKNISVGDEFVLSTRIRIPSFGDAAYLRVYLPEYTLNFNIREKVFAMGGSGGTSYSDEILLGDAWHTIRIESYNCCKNAWIYLDGVKVADTALVPEKNSRPKILFSANGIWEDPFTIQVDWLQYTTKEYDLTINGVIDGAVYQLGDSISLSASGTFPENTVAYYMNGMPVASSTAANPGAVLTGLTAGTYEITAVCGMNVSAPVSFTVEGSAQTESGGNHIQSASNYANEISYTADGDGVVEFANGNHLLKLTHSNGKLVYQTDTVSETYEYGTGKFYVITEGPVADVYRNGQLAFSYYMPIEENAKESFSGNIHDGTVTASAERKTYFSADNVTDSKGVYQLRDLPHSHVIDFVADQGDNAHLALNDGYYRTDVSVEDGKIYIWNSQRNNSLSEKTEVATVDAKTYYRVETAEGMSRLYGNGSWITTFRGAPTVGENTLAVNVSSGSLDYLAVCDNTDIHLYEDAFEVSGEADSAPYWMTVHTINGNDNDMMVSVDGGALSLSSASGTGIAELSAFYGNVDISGDVIVNSGGSVWFIVNHVVSNTYTKVGYRKGSLFGGQYEIIDVINGVEKKIASKTEYSDNFSTKHSIQVKVQESPDGDVVTLLVDGNQILSGVSQLDCRGRVGVMLAKNGGASLDNVAVRGDAKPLLGVEETLIHESTANGAPKRHFTLDMIENYEEGKVYLVNSPGGFVTENGGKTWEEFIVTEGQGYTAAVGSGMTNSTVQKGNKVIAIRRIAASKKDAYGQVPYKYGYSVSHDYGMTWKEPSDIFPDPNAAVGRGATVNAIKLGASGRYYFVSGENGNEDYGEAVVWYSDDGADWKQSATKISAKELGFCVQEAVVVETTDTSKASGYATRLFFRTDMGAICYFESPDRGKTWNLTPHTTPFISSACCYNVEADPEEPNTLYLAWIYDNVNLFARHQFPRTRWSVAKSTDGGKSWEMLGTVQENNSYYNNNYNLNINVSSEYVFVNAVTMDQYAKYGSESNRIIAFPKDVQKTSKRFEKLHLQHPTQVENTRVMPEEMANRAMLVHQESGAIWLHGERYEGAVSGEYISLDCAAALVGATVTGQDDGSQILKIGKAEVRFASTILKKNANQQVLVKLSAFTEKFGLSVVEEDGVSIVSENDDWSPRQRKAFRYAVDLFSNNP